MRTKLFLESTQNQSCFNVEIYRRINVDKCWINVDITLTDVATLFQHISTLNQRWVFAGSEPCHVQNHHIVRTRDIFKTLSRHILPYSKRCLIPPYWEHCHIQNFAIFRIGPVVYLESCLHWHIQKYLFMFNNDS